jgi:hypothetical protein
MSGGKFLSRKKQRKEKKRSTAIIAAQRNFVMAAKRSKTLISIIPLTNNAVRSDGGAGEAERKRTV